MKGSQNFKAAVKAIGDHIPDESTRVSFMQEASQAGNAEQKREFLFRWLKTIRSGFNPDDITCNRKQENSVSAWIVGNLHQNCSRGGEIMADQNTSASGSGDPVRVPVDTPRETLRKLIQALKSSIDSAAQSFAASLKQLTTLQERQNNALAQEVKGLATKLLQETQRHSQEIGELRKKVEEAETKLDEHINNHPSNTPTPPLAKWKTERWLMPAMIGAAIASMLSGLLLLFAAWLFSDGRRDTNLPPSSKQPAASASSSSEGQRGESLEEWTQKMLKLPAEGKNNSKAQPTEK